jgi:hypothetical protein
MGAVQVLPVPVIGLLQAVPALDGYFRNLACTEPMLQTALRQFLVKDILQVEVKVIKMLLLE